LNVSEVAAIACDSRRDVGTLLNVARMPARRVGDPYQSAPIAGVKQVGGVWTILAYRRQGHHMVSIEAVPDQLDLTVRYTVSQGVDQQRLLTAAPNTFGATTLCSNCQGSFPDVTTLLRRLDATAIYKFDPTWVAQMGWTGDVKLKLRYTWESNSVANWANDLLAPFTPAISGTALWLGYNNPNYNVQMIAGSFISTW
jgi:Putative outer membrane beta-barrel porin, MtrB/PioB